ncbi:hypothetical protein HOLleu_30868 [Holothuria leucospilota]|uniref:Protein kinase domain-containing protein n=1 Tax=Holothuria leucospilota TaxID=206669 RepID=A0A9Q1BL25_HOLLE|nr:hypothetical protein HOLleu_30868 [Holothuria leucospilota]
MPIFLGAGNYGAVQLKRIKTTRRLCAVKSQHRHLNEQDAMKNFFREVRVLKSLEGIENVPVFYGLTGTMDGGAIPAIVQEYIGDDGSLHVTSLYDVIEKSSNRTVSSISIADISHTTRYAYQRMASRRFGRRHFTTV